MNSPKVVLLCAVIDDAGRVLLSLREDFNIWNLPGGRLDAGEYMDDAAAREVLEETGVVARVERAIGIYYWQRRGMVGVLFGGFPLGGELQQETSETRANQYFAPDALPDNLMWSIMTLDALAGTRHKPRVIDTGAWESMVLTLRLRWRWVRNWLRGTPEPGFTEFAVSAVGVVRAESSRRILTLRRKRTQALPRVVCTSERAPWEQLADSLRADCGIDAAFRWVGLWQNVHQNAIEFIFAATAPETDDLPDHAEWSLASTAALSSRETDYVARVKSTYAQDAVWLLGRDVTVREGDTIFVDREARP